MITSSHKYGNHNLCLCSRIAAADMNGLFMSAVKMDILDLLILQPASSGCSGNSSSTVASLHSHRCWRLVPLSEDHKKIRATGIRIPT